MVGKVHLLLFVLCVALETQATRMTYGTGMACSYFEGYLNKILPSTGPDAPGLVDNMRMREAESHTTIPVKKLFIIITKSMFCPIDLQEFNKPDGNVSSLETDQPLVSVVIDAAGVVRRSYRAGVYRLRGPRGAALRLAAECATPLHTLASASRNPALAPVFENVDIKEEVEDFATALQILINASSTSRDKCELIYYDDTDSQLNLADMLLNKIREIMPNFEMYLA